MRNARGDQKLQKPVKKSKLTSQLFSLLLLVSDGGGSVGGGDDFHDGGGDYPPSPESWINGEPGGHLPPQPQEHHPHPQPHYE